MLELATLQYIKLLNWTFHMYWVLKSSKNYMNLHFFQTFVWTTLLETVNLKPLIVALMLMLGQQLSGVNAVIFFSVTIFNAAKTSLPSLLENVIVGGNSALRTVSFDWFLSSLESILNLEFCLLKLFIFYQKLLGNIHFESLGLYLDMSDQNWNFVHKK